MSLFLLHVFIEYLLCVDTVLGPGPPLRIHILCAETRQFCTSPLTAVVTKALQGMAKVVGWEGLYRLCIAQVACGDPTVGLPLRSLQYHLEDRTSVLKVTTQGHG